MYDRLIGLAHNLQELYDPRGEKPVHMVDGWNAWYFKDALNLSRVWNGIGANRSDVLELWLGFLRYYYDGFDDKARKGLCFSAFEMPHSVLFRISWCVSGNAPRSPSSRRCGTLLASPSKTPSISATTSGLESLEKVRENQNVFKSV